MCIAYRATYAFVVGCTSRCFRIIVACHNMTWTNSKMFSTTGFLVSVASCSSSRLTVEDRIILRNRQN